VRVRVRVRIDEGKDFRDAGQEGETNEEGRGSGSGVRVPVYRFRVFCSGCSGSGLGVRDWSGFRKESCVCVQTEPPPPLRSAHLPLGQYTSALLYTHTERGKRQRPREKKKRGEIRKRGK